MILFGAVQNQARPLSHDRETVGNGARGRSRTICTKAAALFFVGVGMLFDPAVLVRQPLQVLAVVSIIVAGKPAAALAIVLALRRPLRTALTVSAGLAQVGEFSFIPAGLGVALGLLPPEGKSLVVAGALLSITLNPLVFYAFGRWAPADRPNQESHLTQAA